MDTETKERLPLITCCFDVEISQGYADVVIHQAYENTKENPLETQFLMPITNEFALNKIRVDFIMEDGKTESLETFVCER